MKKILFFVFLFIMCRLSAQVTMHTIKHDGVDREYALYVPQTYNSNTPIPIFFMLHGWGQFVEDLCTTFDFQTMADTTNTIFVLPQGLEDTATISIIGTIPLGTVWNAGARIDTTFQIGIMSIPVSIVPGQHTDDMGFLLSLVDTMKAMYNIDNKVYFTGFSLGGFMCQRLAVEQPTSIIKAIASVSGTLANPLKGQTPKVPVSVLHIHGTADEVVNYNGNLTYTYNSINISVSAGFSAEDMVNYWVTNNHCNTTPTHFVYDNIADDGLTFERDDYSNGLGSTKVAFIKVNNGQHTWYEKPDNDIDYFEEIFAFFKSDSNMVSMKEPQPIQVSVYPNPAKNRIAVYGIKCQKVELFNALGQQQKIIAKIEQFVDIDVHHLPDGIYFLKLTDQFGQITTRKITICR